jgi:hypothetical protein
VKRSRPHSRSVAGGSQLFHRLYTRLGGHGRPPQFIVEFYPYASLAHTIRLREHVAHVRLSDAMRGAPAPVIEATAMILLSRVLRRRTPPESLEQYRRFTLAPATRRRVARLRRSRARPAVRAGGATGEAHDLAPMFTRLNRRYFSGRLRRPRLAWSDRNWRTQFGLFDPALDQIVLNRRLDRAAVPVFVVEYVLFHEMLHVKHPLRATRCHMQAHTREFLQEEKRFQHHVAARRYLNRLG